jgi:dihydrofolate reductase
MSVIASITVSLDGYVTGPEDGPGCGLGVGGERLHYWVMGGPWTYDREHGFDMSGADREFFEELEGSLGAGVCGRGMYDSAGAWGGSNPFGGPLFVLTHRLGDAPDPATGVVFVDDLATAMRQATDAAGDGNVGIGGGANVIPPGARRRLRRRAGDLDHTGHPRRRQAAVRGLRA